jgi:hypothetical protein
MHINQLIGVSNIFGPPLLEARPLAERALFQRRSAISRMPGDPRLIRDLPYYQDLLHRAGGTP